MLIRCWYKFTCESIDQFQYIKIQPKTIDLNMRLWGINPTNSVFIPQSLALRSIVLGWISIYRNWSIVVLMSNIIESDPHSMIQCASFHLLDSCAHIAWCRQLLLSSVLELSCSNFNCPKFKVIDQSTKTEDQDLWERVCNQAIKLIRRQFKQLALPLSLDLYTNFTTVNGDILWLDLF